MKRAKNCIKLGNKDLRKFAEERKKSIKIVQKFERSLKKTEKIERGQRKTKKTKRDLKTGQEKKVLFLTFPACF